MDQTFIIINSILILFYNKTDRFNQNTKYSAGARYGALKGFSDSLATLENHWETSLEEVNRRIAKWFLRLRVWNQERTLPGRDCQQCDQSSRGSTGCAVRLNGCR